jgi:hypothetical protein
MWPLSRVVLVGLLFFACFATITVYRGSRCWVSKAKGKEYAESVFQQRWLYKNTDKVVVVISPTEDPRLVGMVLNALANLPLDWKVQIFHRYALRSRGSPGHSWHAHNVPVASSNENSQFLAGLRPLAELAHTGRIIFTPLLYHRMTIEGYSRMLMNKRFWHRVEGTYQQLLHPGARMLRTLSNSAAGEHVLMIQPDSVLCSKSPYSIDDFLQYDWVGAPWYHAPTLSGNGGMLGIATPVFFTLTCDGGVAPGFSLRNREKMLETIEKCPPNPDAIEDLWFAECFENLRWNGALKVKLAPTEVMSNFAVETIYAPEPFGIHKPWLWLNDIEVLCLSASSVMCLSRVRRSPNLCLIFQLSKLIGYCPELEPLFPDELPDEELRIAKMGWDTV